MKDKKVVLTVQMDESLRSSFMSACAAQDDTAARVIRALINQYLKKHSQPDMFQSKPPKRG